MLHFGVNLAQKSVFFYKNGAKKRTGPFCYEGRTRFVLRMTSLIPCRLPEVSAKQAALGLDAEKRDGRYNFAGLTEVWPARRGKCGILSVGRTLLQVADAASSVISTNGEVLFSGVDHGSLDVPEIHCDALVSLQVADFGNFGIICDDEFQ